MRETNTSRRDFLIGSVAFAGGVAFGPLASANVRGLDQGTVAITPWIVISPKSITLITPHADIGQGVASMQAALLAEELDLDFGQFEISFGTPSGDYANTGLAEEFAAYPVHDRGSEAMAARAKVAAYLQSLGAKMQLTGGSSTVPDSFDKLRKAGAIARETLKLAASKRTGVAIGKLTTKKGAVILPGGRKIGYTELVSEAAKVTPPTDVRLRDKSQWRLLGKPMKRIDIADKTAGQLKFGIDYTTERMVFAAVKSNPYKGGKLLSYDDSVARRMPGVMRIIEIDNGVAAIASNSWYAMKAVEAVECEWAAGNYPRDQADHWSAMERSFTQKHVDKVWRNEGDVDKALTGTDQVVAATYRAPYVGHQPLEPLNATALVTDDAAEIWGATQVPGCARDVVAEVCGLPVAAVTISNQFAGGSFGHRLEVDFIRAAARVAKALRGTPVKVLYSREEDFTQDYPRHLSMGRMRGAVKDGVIVAADLDVSSTPVVASWFGRLGLDGSGPDGQTPAGIGRMTYGIPNLRMTAYRAEGLSPVTSWRSVGASTGGFFSEGFIDELIHAAGKDPMLARIEMCTVGYHRKVLEAVAEMSNWRGPLGNGRGRGVAFVESFGVPCCEVVEVTATEKGIKIDKVWVAVDVGPVLDPINFENNVQGAVVWGLGHAMNCELTYADGAVEQRNYHAHEGMRLYQCPKITVRGLSNGPIIRGIGEPPVPPAAPALANAIFAATGKRIREMPFNKSVDFV